MPAAITVRVPNTLFKDWLTKHYSGVIGEAMSEMRKATLAVNFVADPQSEAVAIPLGPDEAAALEHTPPPVPSAARARRG